MRFKGSADSEALPPGWIRVASRSKPGQFYYAHPATKRTQVERPVDPRQKHVQALSTPTPAPAGAGPQLPSKDVALVVDEDDEETPEERRKKEEARKAEAAARQAAEDAEREEVMQKARERRARERAAAAQAAKEEEEREEQRAQEARERRERKKKQAAELEAAMQKEKEEQAQDDDDQEVTLEDLEKWKEDEENREKEEEAAKKRKEEEEEQKKVEEELEKARRAAEFAEAVERARKMKEEADQQKREELKKAAEAQFAPPPTSPAPDGLLLNLGTTPKAAAPAPPVPVIQPSVAPPVVKPTSAPGATLSSLLSGAVSKPDFGDLLNPTVAEPEWKRMRTEAPTVDVGPQTGRILWWNGRRRQGMLLADQGGQMLQIPARGSLLGGLAPPVPGGLMHGTRVTFKLDTTTAEQCCLEVKPTDGQVGLSCGGDSQIGQRLGNEDRTMATDLQEGLGHMVGIFDGHRGTHCADFLAQNLPTTLVRSVRDVIANRLMLGGTSMEAMSQEEEIELIKTGLKAGFEVTDRNFLMQAQQYGLKDGATALVAVLMHGFQAPAYAPCGTVTSAPGGQAKLFATWCGTGRMLQLRGRQVIRCTEDHLCQREDERRRLEAAGACLVQDYRGMWWVGKPGHPELAWSRQQGYEETVGPKSFLAASRGFGDVLLKDSAMPFLTATPDVQVIDLTVDDWAVVMCSRGVLTAMSDQDVGNAVWESMVMNGRGPQEAAQAITQRALQIGAKDNCTCIVMRLGWAQLPSVA
eukprot:TRINITY_DN79880_c0_g1_i1.p1 TRINITY_DN79880_c0_g1~~TRINITY_DN79880_c0_g1_i1.p1  ORF type:complete len:755 (-),score=202.20 TRINITY_DN79880_c0_g1_i1:24-2288(-)